MNEPRKGMKSRWSLGYKKSINCNHPRGFSQKNYCKRQKRGGRYMEGFNQWLHLNESQGIRLSQEDLVNIYKVQLPIIWEHVREIIANKERISYFSAIHEFDPRSNDVYIGFNSSKETPHIRRDYYYDADYYADLVHVVFMNDKKDRTQIYYQSFEDFLVVINCAKIQSKDNLFNAIVHELVHAKDPKVTNPVLRQARRNHEPRDSNSYKDYMLDLAEFDAYTSSLANIIIFNANKYKKTKKEEELRKVLQGTLLFLSNPDSTEPTILDKTWIGEKERTWDFYWTHANETNKRKMQLRIYKAVQEALNVLNSK